MDIRGLVAVESVANLCSFKLAAKHLNTTQPTLSRLISRVEAELDVTLFRRGWSGTETTADGDVVSQYARTMINAIKRTEHKIFTRGENHPSLVLNLTITQLEFIDAIRRTGGATLAAAELGCAQPAVSRVLNEFKSRYGLSLFERRGRGLTPLAEAAELAMLNSMLHTIFANLRAQIVRDRERLSGRIAIGVLAFSAQEIVPRVFARLSKMHPRVRLVFVPGTYFGLVENLRRREIDGFVGIMRMDKCPPDLIELPILQEAFTVLARHDHPAHSSAKSIADLVDESWLVPPHGSPVRAYFDHLFESANATPAVQTCEIQFFTAAEQMLAESNSIGIQTYSASMLEKLRPDLRKIDIPLPDEPAPIGLTILQGEPEDFLLTVFRQIIDELAPEFA